MVCVEPVDNFVKAPMWFGMRRRLSAAGATVRGGAVSEVSNLDGLAGYAMQQVEKLRQMQERMGELTGEGRSSDGLVVARTGAGGRILELRIDETALRSGAVRLSADVTAAVSAAQAAYAGQADDLMADEMGVRPSDPNPSFDRGMARLDELTDQLEDLTRRLER
jgi:DNA-binding protein YbaB